MGKRNGKHGYIAVYHILPHKHRNTETAFLHGCLLEKAYFLLPLDVEDGAELPLSGKVEYRALHLRPGGDVATGKKIELTYLFL